MDRPSASKSIAAWAIWRSARMSDASPRTVVLPAPRTRNDQQRFRFLDHLDELFTLHSSPTRTLTPSSRRLRQPHRHLLLCGRLPLPPLRLRAPPEENIGRYPRTGLAGILAHALVPVELLLEARLRVRSSFQGAHWDLEFPAAKCADSDCWSGGQPFGNSKAALDHGHLFLRVWHCALLGYRGGKPNGSRRTSRAWLPDLPKRRQE